MQKYVAHIVAYETTQPTEWGWVKTLCGLFFQHRSVRAGGEEECPTCFELDRKKQSQKTVFSRTIAGPP